MASKPKRLRWLTPDEMASWRAYLRGSRLLMQALEDGLDECQLSEFELLAMVSESPGQRIRMSVLADRIVQSRSRVTHTAARLEKRGWVTRQPSAEDGRGVELTLTNDGRDALREIAKTHLISLRAALIDVLTPEQLANLGEAMTVIRDHLAPDHHEIGLDD